MPGSGDDRGVLDELVLLADELLEQATEIRQQWTELADVLGARPAEAEPAAAADAAPAEEGPNGGGGGEDAEAVRLVALDMMLSGRSRDEVGEYLAATFAEADVEAILDDVFSQYG